MSAFTEAVKECDIIAYRSFPDLKISAEACICMYKETKDDKYLKSFTNMGFDLDENGNIFKK